MADVEFALRIEQVGIGAFAGKRGDGKRRDEVLRGRSEDTARLRAAVLQPADQIERLIGGNAAADDQKDTWDLGRSSDVLVLSRTLRGLFEAVRNFVARALAPLPAR